MRFVLLVPLAACVGSSSPNPDLTITTNLKHAKAVSVDQSHVYWIADGTDANNGLDGVVMKANPDGTGAVALASPVDFPTSIAVDASHVYWATYGTNEPAFLMKAALDGSDVTTIVTLPSSTPSEIAVDATSIYWADLFDGTISKATLDGTDVTMLASGQASASGIEVDATDVYWMTGNSIVKCSLAGTNPTVLAAQQSSPLALAIDGSHVYWTTRDTEYTGSIKRVALDGSNPTTLTSGHYIEPESIAIGDDAVYWANRGTGAIIDGTSKGDGSVMRVGFDGTAVTVLAKNEADPLGIAVSANDIFWATGGTDQGGYQDGTIRRIAR